MNFSKLTTNTISNIYNNNTFIHIKNVFKILTISNRKPSNDSTTTHKLAMTIFWWLPKGVDPDSGGSVALTLANVGGVFIVLLGGCIASIFVTVAEMLYDVWMTVRTEKVKWDFVHQRSPSIDYLYSRSEFAVLFYFILNLIKAKFIR